MKQFERAPSAYNLQVGLRLRGKLTCGALERSLQEIVDLALAYVSFKSLESTMADYI